VTSFKDIFLRIYDDILREPSESAMDRQIADAFATNTGSGAAINYANSCERADTLLIRKQLEALGLIETKAKVSNGSFGGMYVAWIATDKGRKYYASHVAIKAT